MTNEEKEMLERYRLALELIAYRKYTPKDRKEFVRKYGDGSFFADAEGIAGAALYKRLLEKIVRN